MEGSIRELLNQITINVHKIDEFLSESAQSESNSSDSTPQSRRDFSLQLLSLMKKLIGVNFDLECELVELKSSISPKEPPGNKKEPCQSCVPSKISTNEDSGKSTTLNNNLLYTGGCNKHIPEKDETHADPNQTNTLSDPVKQAAPTENTAAETGSTVSTVNLQELEQSKSCISLKEPPENCIASKLSTNEDSRKSTILNNLLSTSEGNRHIPETDEAQPDSNQSNTLPDPVREAVPTDNTAVETDTTVSTVNLQELEQSEIVEVKLCKSLKLASEIEKELFQNCNPIKISTSENSDNSLCASELNINIPERDEAHPHTNHNILSDPVREAAPIESPAVETDSTVSAANLQQLEQSDTDTVETPAIDSKAVETVPQTNEIDNNDKVYYCEPSQNGRIDFESFVNAQNCFPPDDDDDYNSSDVNYGTALDTTDDCQSCISSSFKESSSDDPPNNGTNVASNNTEKVTLSEKDNAVIQNVLTWMDKNANDSEVQFTAIEKLTNVKFCNRKMEALKDLDSRKVLPNNFMLVPQTKGLPVAISPEPVRQQERKYRGEPVSEIAEGIFRVNLRCTFAHIESPSEFYLHTNLSLVVTLHAELNDEYRNHFVGPTYQSKAEAQKKMGHYAVAYVKTKKAFYRVKILDWLLEDKLRSGYVYCHLIDYGEKVFCSLKNLRHLCGVFIHIPSLATRCHFAQLCPVGDTWPRLTIDVLKSVVREGSDPKKFTVIYAQKESDSFAIDLYEENSTIENSLAEHLITSGLAIQQFEQSREPIFDEAITEYDNINEAISGYDARDEARICPHARPNGTCYKGPKCRLEHSELSHDGITTDKVLSYRQAFTQNIIPVEQWVDIVVTGYVNVGHFYIQIIKTPSADSIFNDNFQKLLEIMNSNHQVKTYQLFQTLPGTGELVVVYHNADQWFRATYLRAGPTLDSVELFLVDFGINYTTSLKNVRQMKEEFLHVPFQAVECILKSYCEKPNINSHEAHQFFSREISFKPHKAYICAANPPVPVFILDLNGHDIGFTLQQFGFAQERTADLNPSPDCILQVSS